MLAEHAELKALYERVAAADLVHIFFDDNAADWAPFLRFAHPGHFYSPLPLISECERTAELVHASAAEMSGIDLRETSQLELFRTLAAIARDWPFPNVSTPGFRYWSGADNFAFGIGDGMMLHAMLRHLRPRRLLEVGSGFSSALTLDTNERYLDGSIEVTFVEPYPELLYSLIDEGSGATVLAKPVQDVDTAVFTSLEANDILFLDTTHVSRFGSDVNDLFTRVLPALAPGVVVHLHDIFWPFEYPLEWLQEGRGWNEQYLLRAFLQFNDHFEVLLFNDWLGKHHAAVIKQELPRMLEALGGSIWLRRVD